MPCSIGMQVLMKSHQRNGVHVHIFQEAACLVTEWYKQYIVADACCKRWLTFPLVKYHWRVEHVNSLISCGCCSFVLAVARLHWLYYDNVPVSFYEIATSRGLHVLAYLNKFNFLGQNKWYASATASITKSTLSLASSTESRWQACKAQKKDKSLTFK